MRVAEQDPQEWRISWPIYMPRKEKLKDLFAEPQRELEQMHRLGRRHNTKKNMNGQVNYRSVNKQWLDTVIEKYMEHVMDLHRGTKIKGGSSSLF